MLKNYLFVTLRTMFRNKVFSLITVCGLAIALAACFLLYQYVLFESGYDKFQSKNIYRVSLRYLNGKSVTGASATNASAAGPSLKSEFSEVKDYTRLVKTSLFTSSLTKAVVNAIELSRPDEHGDLIAFNEENIYMADPGFLTMFSFPLIAGSAPTALKDPNTVVLTESIAKKYFGNESPIGKQLMLNRELPLSVTGVLKNIPANSHLQFDILISYSTLERTFSDSNNFWGWSVFYTYITLDPQANPTAVEAKMEAFVKKRAPNFADYGQYHTRMFLQPLPDIHLYSKLYGEQSQGGSERTVYFLSMLSLLILVIAWINYVNLSTAKALERSKEVGLRKVVGATKKQLLVQFFTDAFLTNVFALVIATAISFTVWPFFQGLTGKQITIEFFSSPQQWLVVAGVLVAGIFVAGAYPALMLSSFNPAVVLKGKYFKSASGSVARKAMISVQYFIALLLIAATLMLYRQLSFLEEQDPGYAKDRIMIVEGPAVYDSLTNGKIDALKNELLRIPGINSMAASANIPGQSIVEHTGVVRQGAKDEEGFGADILGTDTSFLSTYGIRLLEGRQFRDNETMNFRPGKEPELIQVVVNEQFVKGMGIANPKDALNEKFKFWWGPDERHAQIVGVTANHHQLSLKETYSPIMYMQPKWTTWKYFSINISGRNFADAAKAIGPAFKKIFPDNPLVSFTMDDYYGQQYKNDETLGQLIGVFTALAIIVTCLGLVGLTIFSVSQRIKEIGIRKVLGSPLSGILYLFSRDLIKILIGAYAVAVPLIFFGSNRWLEQFPFKTTIGWSVVATPLLLLLMITIVVVTTISLRRALDNPVTALRHE
jgi:putative ABC transport system permease protein